MKKHSKILLVFFSLGFLSFGFHEQGSRKIACIDGIQPIAVVSGTIPLEADLFSHIQDQTEKANAQYYYNFLKQTESNYYLGLQNARTSYGLSGGIWGDIPKISYSPVDLNQPVIANKGTLWSGFLSNMFFVQNNQQSPLVQGNAPQIGSPLFVR